MESALPGEPDRRRRINMLHSIRIGVSVCWLLKRGHETRAAVLTVRQQDRVVGGSYVLIYALKTNRLSREEWEMLVESLRTYADNLGAKALVAPTPNEALARGARLLGAEVEQLITFEV